MYRDTCKTNDNQMLRLFEAPQACPHVVLAKLATTALPQPDYSLTKKCLRSLKLLLDLLGKTEIPFSTKP